MPKQKWSIEPIAKNSHRLNIDLRTGACKEHDQRGFKVLLTSDWHFDNPKCDRELLFSHLEQAKKINAPVFCFGDLFCAMQGKFDKRSAKSDIRPEHNVNDYLDALVRTTVKELKPYKNVIALIGEGNHESSVKRNHETSLHDRLCAGLRDSGGVTQTGCYMGWVSIKAHVSKTSRKGLKLMYYHGSGGGAPVTKGAIEFNRLAEQYEADIYCCGHIHRINMNINVKHTINDQGMPLPKQIDYVRTPSYKVEDSTGGWAVEKRQGPRPIGAYWLTIRSAKSRKYNMTGISSCSLIRSYTNTEVC